MTEEQTDIEAVMRAAKDITDEDERQEYICLRLEGFTHQTARAKAPGAKLSNLRNRGPGRGAYTSLETIETWPASMTLDTRTAEEREAAALRSEEAHRIIATLPAYQRAALEARYLGPDGERSMADTMRVLGWSYSRLESALVRGRRALRSATV